VVSVFPLRLDRFAVEAGFFVALGVGFGVAGGAVGGVGFAAVAGFGGLFAEGGELLGFGAEAADVRGGCLGDEVAHRGNFLMSRALAEQLWRDNNSR